MNYYTYDSAGNGYGPYTEENIINFYCSGRITDETVMCDEYGKKTSPKNIYDETVKSVKNAENRKDGIILIPLLIALITVLFCLFLKESREGYFWMGLLLTNLTRIVLVCRDCKKLELPESYLLLLLVPSVIGMPVYMALRAKSYFATGGIFSSSIATIVEMMSFLALIGILSSELIS